MRLRGFRLGRDAVIGTAGPFGGRALQWGIQLAGLGAIVEDGHPDHFGSFFEHQAPS